MYVYRITREKYCTDLSGSGASRYSGRWNQKGVEVIYTSGSRALAALEHLVHLPYNIVHKDLKFITIDIPDDLPIKDIPLTMLPENWQSYPPPKELIEIGTRWVQSNESLLLRVHSAIITEEFNILINPRHPDMKQIKISNIEDYEIDSRLLKK